MTIEDARLDDRFVNNLFVTSANPLLFYAGAPLITPSGHAVGILCITDSRPRKFNQAQRARLEALAQQVVTQLELRKKVADLGTAIADAWRAYNVKSQFLANMSHEIRTPMNGIIEMTDLLLESPDCSEEESEKLRLVQGRGNSLLQLINDILDFSQLEARKLELENRPYCLKELTREIIGIFKPVAKKKGILISFDTVGDLPERLVGDAHRVRQVMNNLISNALKFTFKGSVRIEISGRKLPNQSFETKISVRDSGIGIEPENLQKIFRSFSQVDASTNRKFGGSGLGLSISYNLCRAMGGDLKVESEYGRGTTFTFFIVSQTSNAEDITCEVEYSQRKPAIDQSLKILVADDNSINQKVISALLRNLGFSPTIVADGVEAIEALRTSDFDVIFMDCLMPQMDGFEATERIRRDFSMFKQPRIIALTASARAEDQQRCLEVGMDDYLTKPMKNDVLRKALARVSKTR